MSQHADLPTVRWGNQNRSKDESEGTYESTDRIDSGLSEYYPDEATGETAHHIRKEGNREN